jgi:hypothetical protein
MTALLPTVCPGLAVGCLVACIALAARATWQRTHRPVTPAVNRDVLAPPGPLYGARRLPVRPVPPVVADATHDRTVRGIWQENPMRDTLVVARPLWWDATERKEYER